MTDLHVEGTPAEAVPNVISRPGLAALTTAELADLRQTVAGGARSGDDDVVDRSARTDKLIAAELYLRVYTQAAIDAKAAAIIDEERRLACALR